MGPLELRSLAPAWARKSFRHFFPWRDYVLYRGVRLPRPESRLNQADQKDNRFFLNSAEAEVRRVIDRLGCTRHSLLVDIGFGQGRLAIGLVRHLPELRYRGLDVLRSGVQWCRNHIEARHPSYQFRHLDLVNARYHPEGSPMDDGFRLPVGSGAADVVYMWGVVTNMEPEHLPPYAREIARMLRDGGRLFLTANIEPDVPTAAVNPDGYVDFECVGPLNIVRYEREYFLEVFRREGLILTALDYHAAGNCQSELYFEKGPIAH